jgi:NAD(P)-dependent dehydrogenase (short-subunit alcohol dehydrogenase family)/pimeloyl-ACP methyl ester carboxylesterase
MDGSGKGSRAQTVMGDGVALHVVRSGPSDAPTIVLVHGYPDTHACFGLAAAKLAERFHVVAYDVRGAGASAAPATSEGYRLAHLHADLRAVIDAVSPNRPVHLVGHDWGAIQAFSFVDDPKSAARVASLTIAAAPHLGHAKHRLRTELRSGSPSAMLGALRQALSSHYIGLFKLEGLAEHVLETYGERLMPNALARAGVRNASWSAARTKDAIAGLALYRENIDLFAPEPIPSRITVPVQTISCLGDRFVTRWIMQSAVPFVDELFVRESVSGHWLPLEHPERFASYVTELVDHVETGRTPRTLARARTRTRTRSFEDQLVVVTGAGSGIGRALVLALARRGASFGLVDLVPAGLEETARLAREAGAGEIVTKALDVTDDEAVSAFARDLIASHGAPDVLVNNAGIGLAGGFLATPKEDFDRVMRVNGVVRFCRAFIPSMVARGEGGHVVNLASAAAFMESSTLSAYGTSKATVLAFSKNLAAELAPMRIHVSAICPGVVNTGITERTRFVGDVDEAALRKRTTELYRKRGYGPERVADAIVETLEHPAPVVPVTPEAHALHLASRFVPGLARRLASMGKPLG